MCGICGTVAVDTRPAPGSARRRVEAMLEALSHRGPDAVGSNGNDAAMMGATRLAIRGIHDGLQPIIDPASGVMAVCNGEIDNHRELRTWLASRGREVKQATDVAVIPALYAEVGDAFAEKLVGAFAAAVWDPRRQRLVLARDRAGERPLFYAHAEDGFVFATELAAMVSDGRLPVALDVAALKRYLQFGIFPSPGTPFAQVQKVAPGEIVVMDADGVHRRRYWRWSVVETPKSAPSLDAFDKLFRESVRRQSDVDVDFGVFLSGGIDSSLVSAVVRSLHPARSVKAYTLRFEEASFDEGSFADVVARQLKLDLISVWVRPEDMRAGLRSLIHLVGEPLADPAWIPAALLARRASQDVRLALVGEGADELFGGYPTYPGALLAERFARWPAWLRSSIRRAVEAIPPSDKKVTISFLLKRFVQGAEQSGLSRHRLWVSNIAPALLQRLGVEPAAVAVDEATTVPLLAVVPRWDLETSLAEGLLTKADRAGMSSALELRAPFLDKAVMQFAASLPAGARVKGFQTKAFLKKYALRYLSREIVHRRKRGLSVPVARWLRGPWRDWASASLASPRLESAGLRKGAALELFEGHCGRKADHARALGKMLVLSEWLDWVAQRTQSPSDAR
ncbi:MAG TPA: asparagine synthase (glutamine-hydrolyzing) [Verrucomicrobiota bacterium]|nr:asparagine synthase (glutamine-hydrolyzing) [Verrucomicrobiota bacterium]